MKGFCKQNILFFILVQVVFISTCLAQKSTADIRNITLDVIDNKVVVNYDIVHFKPGQQFAIGIYFLDQDGKSYYPKSLSGDVGKNIPGGSGRSIVWDISGDYEELNFVLRPHFIVNGMRKGASLGGPENAYLSMILPGLGDYFVVDPRETFFKPYMRSAAYLTFLGLGIKGLHERERVVVPVNTGEIQREIVGYVEGENNSYPIYQNKYDEYGRPVYKYVDQKKTEVWLFNGDFELFFAAAGTIWLLDVIYVSNKGKKNQDAREYYLKQQMLQLGLNANGISLTYTF